MGAGSSLLILRPLFPWVQGRWVSKDGSLPGIQYWAPVGTWGRPADL